jgi:PAS domain S-box-containing protein
MIEKKKIVDSILHASEIFFGSDDIKKCMSQFLGEILELTESEYGFIGTIEQNETQKYLKTLAISNIAWNEETLRFYKDNHENGLEFFNLNSLFGEVIRTGKVVISNKPSEDKRGCGIPAGHPPLERFLGIPLYSGHHFVGMLGIANCSRDYSDEMLKDLQPVNESIANLIENYLLHQENKHLEEDLVSGQSFLDSILLNTADAMITINKIGIIQSVNKAALALFDYKESELLGENIKVLVPVAHRDKHDGYLEKYLDTGLEYVINSIRELRAAQKDGTEIPIELSVSKVNYGNISFLGIIRDLRLRDEYLEGVENARLAAEKSDNAKSEFLAIMSHELRTPLHGVMGPLQILLDDVSNKNHADLLKIAYESSQNLLGLLNSVVEYSKLISGLSQKEDVDFYLEEVLVIIEELFATQALGKGIDFVVDKNGLNHSIFRGDEFKIKQILLNLVDNAVKFTNAGFVKLSIELVREETFCHCRFIVEDTGLGISQEKQEVIFDHFTQVDSSLARTHEGLGLGLSIAREMAQLLDGDILVSSTPGEGSLFTFELPLKLAEAQVFEGVSVEASRILIVDDNRINQKILYKMLEKMSLEADIAEDGFEAVKLFKANSYSLILMDLMMPKMDGYEATEKILAMDPDMPIVAVTANDTVEQMEKCLKVGMKDFIGKPVNLKKLKTILNINRN